MSIHTPITLPLLRTHEVINNANLPSYILVNAYVLIVVGWVDFMVAASNDRTDCVRELLSSGSVVDLADKV